MYSASQNEEKGQNGGQKDKRTKWRAKGQNGGQKEKRTKWRAKGQKTNSIDCGRL